MALKKFLEENLDLIKDNDFEELYEKAKDKLMLYEISNLTSFFLSCGVDPLPYMNEIPDYYLSESDISEIKIPNNIKSIGRAAFIGCSNLVNVTIGNSVTSIGNNAFSSCSSLKSIVIPDSVTSIGNSAFYNCNNLTDIVIPNSVVNIGLVSFYKCSSLTNITIPNSVTSIGDYAFLSCDNLTDIYYKGTKEEWGKIHIKGSAIPMYTKIHYLH